ncbi:eaa protein, partial [Escherichia coli]
MVPKEPTQAMIKAWLSEIANFRGHAAGYRAALEAAPQEVNRG